MHGKMKGTKKAVEYDLLSPLGIISQSLLLKTQSPDVENKFDSNSKTEEAERTAYRITNP